MEERRGEGGRELMLEGPDCVEFARTLSPHPSLARSLSRPCALSSSFPLSLSLSLSPPRPPTHTHRKNGY